LRVLDLTTEAGRNAFVEAYIDLQVYLNEQVLRIPLYVDIFYDFYPVWLANWRNNSIWGFANAVQRAYSLR